MCLKLQIIGSLAAVGINDISKELHSNDSKGVVEDDQGQTEACHPWEELEHCVQHVTVPLLNLKQPAKFNSILLTDKMGLGVFCNVKNWKSDLPEQLKRSEDHNKIKGLHIEGKSDQAQESKDCHGEVKPGQKVRGARGLRLLNTQSFTTESR